MHCLWFSRVLPVAWGTVFMCSTSLFYLGADVFAPKVGRERLVRGRLPGCSCCRLLADHTTATQRPFSSLSCFSELGVPWSHVCFPQLFLFCMYCGPIPSAFVFQGVLRILCAQEYPFLFFKALREFKCI